MPGPTSVSGVGATVEGGYHGEPLGNQMVAMAEAYTRVKQAEQAHAMEKYKVMLDTMDKLPIDANELRKVAKKAGMPLPKDETIAAIAQVGKDQKSGQGGQPQASSNRGQPAQAGSPAAQGQPQQGQADPNAAAAEAQKKWQDSMTPEQGLQHVLNTWYARAQQLGAAKFKDEKAKIEYSTHLTQLKDAAAGGDTVAAGKLMGAGEVPFNITQLAWQNADPEHKEKMYGLAMGHETDAEKNERRTQIMNGLIHSGLNAADAYAGSEAMASGQTLSPELQKKMGAPTFEQLGKEASFISDLQTLGVPSDKLQSTAATAMTTGNLVSALPKGLQSVASKQLELQKQQIALERARVRSAVKSSEFQDRRVTAYEKKVDTDAKNQDFRNQATLAKLHLAEVTGENTQYLDSLKVIVQMNKTGTRVDPKQLQTILDALKPYGVDEDFIKYLSGSGAAVATPGGDPMEYELGGGKK